MRLHHVFIGLYLISVLSACAAGLDERPVEPLQEPAPAEVANPMASFGRLVSGEWRTKMGSGTSSCSWHWGPGAYSVRAANAMEVYYWHPGRKEVCMLSLSPFARGVAEGTIKFEGETADGVFDLYQTSGHRKMGLRWAFDGPDKYRDTLLEATGPEGLKPMNEWVYIRSKTLTAARPRVAEEAPKPSERMMAFKSLLGCSWDAKGDLTAGDALHLQSSFELIPDVDGIYVCVKAPTKTGEPTQLLDAYIYYHTGTESLRCLALSNRGGVHEGGVTVLDGGALQFDLKGYEGDRVVPRVVRFDFEAEGTLHERVWSLEGPKRTLELDVRHKKLEPKKG
jgi:hypothetical protein